MSRCEDFPCCGHESGCCPSFDENGRQTDMKCTCGASVPLDSRVSICEACLAIDDAEREDYQPDWSEYDDDMDDARHDRHEFEDDGSLLDREEAIQSWRDQTEEY